ncbi:MAG TPA: GNAT family N-acetyltransferase [Herpetosiphonaceae bacterium]|nr:GNAT family N-acetyltransferase [Herpetosiphonaceae bacterium]
MASELERYTLRPATMDDVAAVTELENICCIEESGRPETKESDMRLEFETPGFNLETDTRLVHDQSDKLVGYINVWDTSKPHVNIFLGGRVHPEHRGQGIGTAMLQWGEERARQSIAKAPEGAQVTISQGCLSTDAPTADLFKLQGFALTRHFWRMVAELDGPPAAPALADGITIRPFDPASELPAVVKALSDSFKDHWGYVDEPFEDKLAKWEQYIADHENYDPNLFFVALDGGQIAGIALCWKKTVEDPEMGWVGTLGVRREWRRKGVGLALLLHSFNEFYARGQKRVGLGVDASSLTGATRLYEKAGMRANRQWDRYEKVLRPGVDLRTQTAG